MFIRIRVLPSKFTTQILYDYHYHSVENEGFVGAGFSGFYVPKFAPHNALKLTA